MYNNIIYFILVLLVFTAYQPSDELLLPWWAGLGLGVLFFYLYLSLVRAWFRRLQKSLGHRPGGGEGSQRYSRLLTSLSILSLVFFTVNVYFLGLKDLILAVPLIGGSSALTGLAGLLVFALYLAILWSEAFAAYTAIYHSRLTRGRFVWSQLRFNLPIILPWLIISAAADLIALLPLSGFKEWLDSPAGQIVFFVAFMIGLVVLSPALIRPLWGLVPLPAGPKRKVIEDFCKRNNFTCRDIMLWPLYEGEALTAGVMGLVRRWRYILITRSLLMELDEGELAAVMGHELGHVKRRHLLFYVFFFLGYLVLAYALFDLNIYIFMISDWTMDLLLSEKGRQSTAMTLLLSGPVIIMMIVYFRFIFGAFMRNFERQADLFAFRLTGTIKGLVTSLEKIAYLSGQSRSLPSWHHFSVAQRVDFLYKCEQDPSLVKRHDRKVRLMIAAYCLGLLLAGWAGYYVHQAGLGEGMNRRVAINILEAEIKRHPENARAHRYLGDLYTNAGEMDKALAEYETFVVLNPADPEGINNLAWTLATRPGAGQEDKSRALDLAWRAASLKTTHYILDTLAEILYLNGRTQEALKIIDQALALARKPEDKDYLLKQKAKFEAAAGSERSPPQ